MPPPANSGGGSCLKTERLLYVAATHIHARYDRLLGGNALAFYDLDRRLDGQLTHFIGVLAYHGDEHRIAIDCVARFRHAIEPDNLDLLVELRGLYGGGGSQSGIVAEAEDACHFRIRLKDVLGGLKETTSLSK